MSKVWSTQPTDLHGRAGLLIRLFSKAHHDDAWPATPYFNINNKLPTRENGRLAAFFKRHLLLQDFIFCEGIFKSNIAQSK
jgi:hypothetical protein